MRRVITKSHPLPQSYYRYSSMVDTSKNSKIDYHNYSFLYNYKHFDTITSQSVEKKSEHTN